MVWFGGSCMIPSDAEVLGQTATVSDDLAKRIANLIARLGDANYSTRLSAQSELERIGVIALDQLHAASFHPDPQIASCARYIVQSNQFSWAWDTDPVAVRQILANYGSAPHSEKSAYVDQLQRLEHEQGFPALCRLVRYETQSSLAKRAAMLLLRGSPQIDQTIKDRKQKLVTGLVGGQSQASKWVLKYASESGTFDLEWWKQVLEQEKKLLEGRSGDTNLELVSDLNQWIVEQVITIPALRDQALDMARSLLTLGKSVKALDTLTGQDSTRANELAQWALKHQMPELVQEQHAKLSYPTVSRDFIFGYYLAESYLLQGRKELANSIAEMALNQKPCDEKGNARVPKDQEARDPLRATLDSEFSRNLNRDLGRRSVLAYRLKERGHFQWAEAEYRYAIYHSSAKPAKAGPPTQEPPNNSQPSEKAPGSTPAAKEPWIPAKVDLTLDENLKAMLDLAEMLHSQARYAEAADILDPFVQRYDNEPMFRRQVQDYELITSRILTNYHLYRGDQARVESDVPNAKKHYWNSLNFSNENVDALIGLYKLPLETADKMLCRTKLKELVQELRRNIRDQEEHLKTSNGNEHAYYSGELSNSCNTLAWLIANTEGSKEEALFLSRQACSLFPDSAEYYDTLAHCYAALGEYQDAVQQQLRALELKPHHPELRKALERFESLKAQSPK
jgi:tetratricopeptide (TPR) repeat protein